jgi:hypothetical protein
MWYGVLCCGMVFYAVVWCFMLLYGVLSGVVWYCVKTPGFCDHSSSFA